MTLKLQAEEELFGAAKRMARIMGADFVLNEQGKALVEARAKELESRTLPLDGDVVERLREIGDELQQSGKTDMGAELHMLANRTATRSGDGELREALEQARAAIMQAAKDTLWCDETCPAETVVDKIDAALSSIRDR